MKGLASQRASVRALMGSRVCVLLPVDMRAHAGVACHAPGDGRLRGRGWPGGLFFRFTWSQNMHTRKYVCWSERGPHFPGGRVAGSSQRSGPLFSQSNSQA